MCRKTPSHCENCFPEGFFSVVCCLCVAELQCPCASHSIYLAGLHACPSQCSVILCTMFVGVLACVAYFQGKSRTWLVVSRSYIAFSSTGRDMNTRNQLSFRTFRHCPVQFFTWVACIPQLLVKTHLVCVIGMWHVQTRHTE